MSEIQRPDLLRGAVPTGDSGHLRDKLLIVYRRRWTVLAVFLIVAATALVRTFTAPELYEATVRLQIDAEKQNIVSFREVIEQEKPTVEYFETHFNVLRSRTLARKTLEALGLWHGGQAGGAAAGQGLLETEAQSAAIDGFLAGVRIRPVPRSRLVDVSFQSADPVSAARAANALARTYIQHNLELRFMASREASAWLQQRLGEQRAQLEASESRLQRYREQHDAVSLDERQNMVLQKLGDINAAVTRAKMERIDREAVYRQIESARRDRANFDSFPAVFANPFIQQLKAELAGLQRQHAQLSERFGERHPEIARVRSAMDSVEARLDTEMAKAFDAVRNDYQAARARERSLVRALEAQQAEALSLDRKAIEYVALEREATTNRQIFDALLQRARETDVAGELRTSNVRIIDGAELPREPVLPQRGRDLWMGLLAALFLAGAAALVFEYFDDRVKLPEEVMEHLGVPFLGFVPLLSSKALGSAAPLIGRRAHGSFLEAFRTVRTNVVFSSADENARSLVVTSAGPGEGKTVVACNLAIALAQSGRRVLLVDADMRRPQAHQLCGVAQTPGLSDVMVGTSQPVNAVVRSQVNGLWILPAGVVPPNPPELLGSGRFSAFLAGLRDHFEWIIIDSPPVQPVTDAAVLSHVASGVLFVVGSDMTNRAAAKAAVDQLRAVGGTLYGAVLNKVDLDRHRYYYSRYYRREYSEYYA